MCFIHALVYASAFSRAFARLVFSASVIAVDLGFFGAAAAAAAAGRGLAAAPALAFAFAAASAAFFLACVCSNVSKIESLVRGCFFPGRFIALFFMMEPSGIL